MKKTLALLLCVSFMLTLAPFVSQAEQTEPYKWIFSDSASLSGVTAKTTASKLGNINGDANDAVTMSDLLMIRMYLSRSIPVTDEIAADINEDGNIYMGDLLLLRKILKGMATYGYANTSLASSEFDSEGAAKLTVTKAGTRETGNQATAVFDFSQRTVNAESYDYAIITYKASVSSAATVKLCTGEHITPADGCCTAAFTTNGDGDYHSLIIDLSATACWLGNLNQMSFDFFTAPSLGDTMYIDSIIFTATAAEANTAASERTAAKNTPPVADSFYTVSFKNGENTALLTDAYHTGYAYNPTHDAIQATVSESRLDPQLLLNLDSLDLSADTYKYVIYTYMIPSNNGITQPGAELFFSAGEITQPTASYSSQFDINKDGVFRSRIIDLSLSTFWTGKIHSIRMDYFCNAGLGDTAYIQSVSFASTIEMANELALDYEGTSYRSVMHAGLYHDGTTVIPYRFYIPDAYDGTQTYPVVMYMHGAGERGTDNVAQISTLMPTFFSKRENPLFNSIVFAPQCPVGEQWVDTPWTAGNYSIAGVPESNEMQAVWSIMTNAFENMPVDMGRVYAMGLSMGGFGTWDIMARHSDYFSGGIPICGGGDPSYANVLKDMAIYTFHGSADGTVPIRGTKGMYDAIIAAGGTTIRYKVYAGEGHLIWDFVDDETGLLDWLFAYSKNS